MFLLWIVGFLIFFSLIYLGRGFWAWVLSGAVVLSIWSRALGMWGAAAEPSPISSHLAFVIVAGIYLAALVFFGIPALRRRYLSRTVMRLVAGILPRVSETERAALDAGTIWWDGALFSGKPDWREFLQLKLPELSAKEKAFLEGPTEKLCGMIDEWEIVQKRDLPESIWAFLKKEGFFGMIIPEKYGGLGFSAIAHSAVVAKLASRSVTVCVTAMVPNSLGPAELLLHYGTEEQKDHYLPRLARGEEVPCFALTETPAGSDAASGQSHGIVCRGMFNGKEVLGMRLNWEKRYTTLSSVATIIGLAFKLYDPEHLLSKEEDLGITCALIPSNLPGIKIGERHDPLGIPFVNGPNSGTDVFTPLDFIIGGPKMAGQGWRMLMDCLAAGRSISLPSLSTGVCQKALRVASAYSLVREQFNMPIGRFEGIEERLARMTARIYWTNASRIVTAGAVDLKEKPSVLSAIVKAYSTEDMRRVVNDAMDIQAGAGICRGPKNSLERFYLALPIGITVEGANILTRSMIIYGQGAIRCHPFVTKEIEAIETKNLAKFDRAFFGHMNFVLSSAVRSLGLGLTGSRLTSPGVSGLNPYLKNYLRHLTRLSSAFAFVSDVAMAVLGGSLKRKEKISGRFADALAYMYLASCTAKHFYDCGQPKNEEAFMRSACEEALFEVQGALKGIIENFPMRLFSWILRLCVFPLGARLRPPSDRLGAKVVAALLEDSKARNAVTETIFLPEEREAGLGQLEFAAEKLHATVEIQKKIKQAVRSGGLPKAAINNGLIKKAISAGVISKEEGKKIDEAHDAQMAAVAVDAFDFEAFKSLRG